METPRVKLYGLFSMTRRRYLAQAVVAVVGATIVLIGWCLTWPGSHGLHARLTRPELPPSAMRDSIVAVLNSVPWIILAGVVYQAAEAYFVLRRFARKMGK